MFDIRVVGRLVIFSVATVFAAAPFTGISVADEHTECLCESAALAKNFSKAHQVFTGQIVTGEEDLATNSVNFTVRVDRVFRGAADTTMRLSTSLSDECRVAIFAGATHMFILGKDAGMLTVCDGSFELPSSQTPLFSAAVDLVENYDALQENTGDTFYRWVEIGAMASYIEQILALAHDLDPHHPEKRGGGGYTYRGLEVQVRDGEVVGYDWQ